MCIRNRQRKHMWMKKKTVVTLIRFVCIFKICMMAQIRKHAEDFLKQALNYVLGPH